MIRDQALAASGLLVAGWAARRSSRISRRASGRKRRSAASAIKQDHGEALYRRSLYTFWRRIVGPTMFFDIAARQTCTVKTVPDQHAAARPGHAQRRDLRRSRPGVGRTRHSRRRRGSPKIASNEHFACVLARRPTADETASLAGHAGQAAAAVHRLAGHRNSSCCRSADPNATTASTRSNTRPTRRCARD